MSSSDAATKAELDLLTRPLHLSDCIRARRPGRKTMISRKHRFHGHNSLTYLFRNGRTVRVEMMSLRYTHSRHDDYRAAVVVSKKVSKSAVVRNRIRRRIYESLRLHRAASNSPWRTDMSFTVYDERLADVPYQELSDAVERLLKKAGII